MDTIGGNGSRVNWEMKIDVYTLLTPRVKQTTNEDLLYGPGNTTQCSVVT